MEQRPGSLNSGTPVSGFLDTETSQSMIHLYGVRILCQTLYPDMKSPVSKHVVLNNFKLVTQYSDCFDIQTFGSPILSLILNPDSGYWDTSVQ